MRVCLLSFSGRKKPGNCFKVLQYIGEVLENRGVEYSLLNMTDYKINGCGNCSYECMVSDRRQCCHEDHVAFLYKTIAAHDLAIMALPVYSGAPCSRFFAFNERSQSVFGDLTLYERYSRITKNYVVIGNEEAGGLDALNMISVIEENVGEVLLLQSHHYGLDSLSGTLTDISEVKSTLDMFVQSILLGRVESPRK
ncbi:MAG: NAD(P)H-dependent oxidoreductase [Firmicutes bacterium]|nr:NAD(P)H-dependent oxidoreductase [Bacillota bacterium]